MFKNLFFADILKVNDEYSILDPDPNPDPLARGMDPDPNPDPNPDPLARGMDTDPDPPQNVMDPQHCLAELTPAAWNMFTHFIENL